MPAGIVARRRHEPFHYFLKSSLLVGLTIGWLLGAIELSALTTRGAWQATAAHLISPALFQVHGQSQLIGWVGLFIMGIAYQVIPRQRRTAIHAPVVAYVVLVLMLAGVTLRAIAQPFAAGAPLFGWLTVVSALLELAGLLTFMGGLIRGRVMADSIQGPERFSRAALQWFVLALLLNLFATVHMALTGSATVPDWLDRCLIVVELFGLITSMIFGVNARNLPLFMPVKPSANSVRAVLPLLTVGTLLAAGAQVLSVVFPQVAAVVSLAGWLALLTAAIVYLCAVGLLRPRARSIVAAGRSRWYEAYVLTAYFWLVLGLLLEIGNLVAALTGIHPPADDLFLAGLHAITVGFVSTMIMGMAARIVPAFGATRLWSQKLLVATWVCVTAGTALRIPSQVLYTVTGGPFINLLGISGDIQLLALVLFAVNLWRTLDSSATDQETAARRPAVMGIGKA
jgi:hypothetical protein